jgi:hypothetical protein
MSKNDKTTLVIFLIVAALAAYTFYKWNQARTKLNTMTGNYNAKTPLRRELNPEEENARIKEILDLNTITLDDLEGGRITPIAGGINIPAGPISNNNGPTLGFINS